MQVQVCCKLCRAWNRNKMMWCDDAFAWPHGLLTWLKLKKDLMEIFVWNILIVKYTTNSSCKVLCSTFFKCRRMLNYALFVYVIELDMGWAPWSVVVSPLLKLFWPLSKSHDGKDHALDMVVKWWFISYLLAKHVVTKRKLNHSRVKDTTMEDMKWMQDKIDQ